MITYYQSISLANSAFSLSAASIFTLAAGLFISTLKQSVIIDIGVSAINNLLTVMLCSCEVFSLFTDDQLKIPVYRSALFLRDMQSFPEHLHSVCEFRFHCVHMQRYAFQLALRSYIGIRVRISVVQELRLLSWT
jgi:hypothetical protein